jgi:hypothetical protein
MKTRTFLILVICALGCLSFGDPRVSPPPEQCNPSAKAFDGYTFIHPGIVQSKSAYAPYLVRFGDYYNSYLESDIAKKENLREWQGRFCYQAPDTDIERVVYLGSRNELQNLYNAAQSRSKDIPLPFTNNLFASQIVQSGCSEVPEYLMFKNACERFATMKPSKWNAVGVQRDSQAMANLILEGLDLFKHTESHFLRQRIAYQVVRMAHYNYNYAQVVELYNFLLPKVDRRKPSIIYFWTLGHLAGALQKLGKRPEAAYRYMQVFRQDPGKRSTAHRSFYLRDEAEWRAALALCINDKERASMYIMRAAASEVKNVDDLKSIYQLDPGNDQLGLLLVSAVQSVERVLLTNQYTELVHQKKPNVGARNEAARRLIALQSFTHEVIKEGKADNIKLWRCMDAYCSILRFDDYQSDLAMKHCRAMLDPKDPYDKELTVQLDIWTHLLNIHKIRMDDPYAQDAAFRVRSYAIHMIIPSFEPYLKERLGVAFGKSNNPGKAVVAAFDKKALLFKPDLAQLDDLIGTIEQGTNSAIETDLTTDRMMQPDKNYFVDAKGMALLGMHQPEAALQTLQQLTPGYTSPKYSPFKEYINEQVNRAVADSVNVTRQELAAKIIEYEFAAKANFTQPDKAAKYYYLLGLCYYNCSYFGYSWQAFDAFRSGSNWTRLSKGPVFGAANTPFGNLEILDLNTSLEYFEKAIKTARSEELKAKAIFMAARCRQKQWFCDAKCTYKPGNKEIPVVPDAYAQYHQMFLKQATKTEFYKQVVGECKWFGVYARRR